MMLHEVWGQGWVLGAQGRRAYPLRQSVYCLTRCLLPKRLPQGSRLLWSPPHCLCLAFLFFLVGAGEWPLSLLSTHTPSFLSHSAALNSAGRLLDP